MARTVEENKKLLNRVTRIRGQLDAIARALDQSHVAPAKSNTRSAGAKAYLALIATAPTTGKRILRLTPPLSPTSYRQIRWSI